MEWWRARARRRAQPTRGIAIAPARPAQPAGLCRGLTAIACRQRSHPVTSSWATAVRAIITAVGLVIWRWRVGRGAGEKGCAGLGRALGLWHGACCRFVGAWCSLAATRASTAGACILPPCHPRIMVQASWRARNEAAMLLLLLPAACRWRPSTHLHLAQQHVSVLGQLDVCRAVLADECQNVGQPGSQTGSGAAAPGGTSGGGGTGHSMPTCCQQPMPTAQKQPPCTEAAASALSAAASGTARAWCARAAAPPSPHPPRTAGAAHKHFDGALGSQVGLHDIVQALGCTAGIKAWADQWPIGFARAARAPGQSERRAAAGGGRWWGLAMGAELNSLPCSPAGAPRRAAGPQASPPAPQLIARAAVRLSTSALALSVLTLMAAAS